ncbi:hypothetical protein, partial [Anoxybacillus flavithermus]
IYLVFKHESGAGNHQKKGCMDHISIELTPKSKLISNHHGFRFMDMYTKAYQRYVEKCREFGIEAIDLIEFIRNLTTEQVQHMIQS